MRSASYQPSSDRRRATSLALTILAHVLLLLLLLHLAPPLALPRREPRPTSFQMLPDRQVAKNPGQRAKPVEKITRAKGKPAPHVPATPAETATPAPVPPTAPPDLLHMSAADLAAADISRMPSSSASRSGASGDEGEDSATAYGPGDGPGGQHLYAPQWVREPTHTELAFYLPPEVLPGSWAIIKCQTVERNHVENCQSVGESPVGSGLARGVRAAAWQFLVLPPRIGGHPMVGKWVSIRIDFTDHGEVISRR